MPFQRFGFIFHLSSIFSKTLNNIFLCDFSKNLILDDFRKTYTMRYANADTTRFRPEKWRIPFFLVRGQAKNLTSYIDIRPPQSLPDQQPNCQLVRNLKNGDDGKIPRDY